jgi:hypothetical protein
MNFGTMACALKLLCEFNFESTLKTKCMKTIFTLFTSLIMSIAVFATDARPKSSLIINSSDRGDIRVIVDGRRFEPNDNYMRIQGIEVGNHDVKVYRERSMGGFTIFGRNYEMVFNSCITVRPRTNVMIAVDRLGKATVNESRMNGWYGRDDRGFGDRDDKGFGDRTNRDWDKNHDFSYDGRGNQGDYDKDRDGKWDKNDRDDRDVKFGDYGTNYGYESAGMDSREFNLVLQSVSKEWFESNRLKSATQIVTANSLTTAQVKQLILLFNFESNKLDLAKKAYQNTVDKKNYYMINDVFSFNNSKAELARYIQSCQ